MQETIENRKIRKEKIKNDKIIYFDYLCSCEKERDITVFYFLYPKMTHK